MTKKTSLDVATEYTNRGWKVVPARFRGKGCLEPKWGGLKVGNRGLTLLFQLYAPEHWSFAWGAVWGPG